MLHASLKFHILPVEEAQDLGSIRVMILELFSMPTELVKTNKIEFWCQTCEP